MRPRFGCGGVGALERATVLPDATDASAELDADATRRAFLKKVAIGGAVAALGTQVLPFDRLVPSASGQEDEDAPELTPDEEQLTFLASLALAGAATYRAATGDEPSGDEGEGEGEEEAPEETTTTLPPIEVPVLAEPVVEILRTFGSHHAQQAVALNGALSVAVAAPNPGLLQELRTVLAAAADEAAVLDALRDLEERLAATHLAAIGELEDANDASLVATALPIVAQHAVVLGLIGTTPTPLAELVPEEQPTDAALSEQTYPAQPADAGTGDTTTTTDANAGGEGADAGSTETPGDGTESSGGADDGTDSAGSSADPESGN